MAADWPRSSIFGHALCNTVAFTDGSRKDVPLEVIQRSPTLLALLDVSEGQVSSALSAESCAVALELPVSFSAYLEDWLACLNIKQKHPQGLLVVSMETVVKYLHVRAYEMQASDFFADEGALRACCNAIGVHLFESSSTNTAVISGSAFAGAQLVVEQLPEHLLLAVLRESPHGLDRHLRRLDKHLHALAVHAACPEITNEGSLVLKCSNISFSSFSAALGVLTNLPAVQSLSLDDLSLLTDFCEQVTPEALQCSFALDLALRSCPKHIRLKFSAISQDHVMALMHSMRRSMHIQSLDLTFPQLDPYYESELFGAVARLTTLKSLDITSNYERERCKESIHLREMCDLHQLSSLVLLQRLHIDIECFQLSVDGDELTECLNGMRSLQHLHAPLLLQHSPDIDTLASALVLQTTCLTYLSLRSFWSFEHAPFLHDEGQPLFNGLYQSLPNALASACTNLQHLDLCEWGADTAPDDDCLHGLVRAVRAMPRLQSIGISVEQVGSNTLAVIEALGAPGKELQCTHLSLQAQCCEESTHEEACLLADHIRALCSLRHLILGRCLLMQRQNPVAASSELLNSGLTELTHLALHSVEDCPRDNEEDDDVAVGMNVVNAAIGMGAVHPAIAGGGNGRVPLVFIGALGNMSKIASLAYLEITDAYLAEGEVAALANTFPCLGCLNSLKLLDVGTPSGTDSKLATALSALTCLTHLSLACCGFVGRADNCLAQAYLPSLRELCLDWNTLSETNQAAICGALSAVSALTWLSLRHCTVTRFAGHAVMHVIGSQMLQLRCLDLSWISTGPYHSKKVGLHWPAAATQLGSMGGIRALQKLVLVGCGVGESDVALLRAFRSMPELSHVDMTMNNVSEAMKLSLKEWSRLQTCLIGMCTVLV